jgi:hypothetical protein
LEQLRKAHMGNYQIVLSLLSSLDNGRRMKRLVDEIIDCCDAVVNLRENVVEHRIKYSVSTMDDKARQIWLEKALRSVGRRVAHCGPHAHVDRSSSNTST